MKLLSLFWIALTATAADLPPPPAGMDLSEPTPAMCRRTAGTPLGLSSDAVEIGMRSVQGALEGCLGDTTGSLDATLVIGCDGLIDEAKGYDGTTIAPSTVACVLDAIHYASFAPHDMTEGQPVDVRLSASSISVYGQLAQVSAMGNEPLAAASQDVDDSVATIEIPLPSPMMPGNALTATCEDFGVRERCMSTNDAETCTAWAGALLERTDTCYDGHQARQLLLKACDGVNSPAQACWMLGEVHEEGIGGERDRTRAASYYRWACRSGSKDACYRRGLLLEKGMGVARDDELALASHKQACDLGEFRSCLHGGDILNEGTFIDRNIEAAMDLYSSGCQGDEIGACIAMGRLQLEIEPSDPVGARINFERAASEGSLEALRELAYVLWNGIGGKADKKQAKELCRTACQSGDSIACRGPQFL